MNTRTRRPAKIVTPGETAAEQKPEEKAAEQPQRDIGKNQGWELREDGWHQKAE
jgi:hypothetical protein